MQNEFSEIYDLLYSLGVTANYTGFFHMASAIALCREQPGRLLLVTKCLYPEVAKQYNTNWKVVERNIRTAQFLCILVQSLDVGALETKKM